MTMGSTPLPARSAAPSACAYIRLAVCWCRAPRPRRPRGDRRPHPSADPRCRAGRRTVGRRARRGRRHAPARGVPAPQGAARRRPRRGPSATPSAACTACAPSPCASSTRGSSRTAPSWPGASTPSSATSSAPPPPSPRRSDPSDRRPHHPLRRHPRAHAPTAASSASSVTSPTTCARCGTPSPAPERLADWWLPFEADITVDLREGGEMVFAGRSEDEPVTMTCTILRLEPPMLFEHTHPAPGSRMRWELEAAGTGCILRLSHVVPDVQRGGRQLLPRRAADLPRPARAEPGRTARARGTGTPSPRARRTTPSLGLAAPVAAP